MNYNTLQYFVDIVKLKSFTRAAEKNFVAQTALSHAITKVEQELGAQLLIRRPGNIELTEAGKIFYQECENVLAIHRETLAKLFELKKDKKTIRIGYFDIYETTRFAEIKKNLEDEYPDYHIDWVSRYNVPEDSQDVIVGYDYESLPEGDWELKTAVVRKTGFLVANMNPLYKKDRIHLWELVGQDIIVLARDRSIDLKAMEKYHKKRYKECEKWNIKFAFSELEVRTLVECGHGVARFEQNLYRYDRKTCKILESIEPFELSYNIFYKKGMEPVAEIIKEYIEM